MRKYLMALCLLLFSFSALAQELPEVHKINGKKYYLHVVEKGNTLYGISKLYNIEISDIEIHNPVILTEGLKVNQTLLIPVTGENKRDLGGVVNQSDSFIVHRAQPKETLYAISKKYNVKLEVLLLANPEIVENGLKEAAEVRIPMAKVREVERVEIKPAAPDTLRSHIVEAGDTYYSLSKRYNTTIDALKSANPLLGESLRVGAAVRIPGLKTEKSSLFAINAPKKDTIQHIVLDSGDRVSIGLLFPMSAALPDSGDLAAFKISEAQRVALSFYRGFKLAIDSLAESLNVHVNLDLIDVRQDTAVISNLIKSKQIDTFNVLVGPFFTDQFEMVADYAAPMGIPTICPIPKPSKILFKRPNAMKTTASESMQLDALAEILAASYADSNVVLVRNNVFQDQDNFEFFQSRYNRAMKLPDTVTDDAIREIKLYDITRDALLMRFPDTGSYILVVPSLNKVFITKLLSQLHIIQQESKGKYRFRVIGMEDWHKFEADLEVKYLHDLHVTIPLTSYLNHSDYRVRSFYKHYVHDFGFEPDRFTLMGFDLGSYLLTQLRYNHNSWFENPENHSFSGLLMDFHFQRVMPQSGVENTSVRFYEYKHFKLNDFAKWPVQKMK